MSCVLHSLPFYKQSHSYRFKINSRESLGGPNILDSVWDPQLSEAAFWLRAALTLPEGNPDEFPSQVHCRTQTGASFLATLGGSTGAKF